MYIHLYNSNTPRIVMWTGGRSTRAACTVHLEARTCTSTSSWPYDCHGKSASNGGVGVPKGQPVPTTKVELYVAGQYIAYVQWGLYETAFPTDPFFDVIRPACGLL